MDPNDDLILCVQRILRDSFSKSGLRVWLADRNADAYESTTATIAKNERAKAEHDGLEALKRHDKTVVDDMNALDSIITTKCYRSGRAISGNLMSWQRWSEYHAERHLDRLRFCLRIYREVFEPWRKEFVARAPVAEQLAALKATLLSADDRRLVLEAWDHFHHWLAHWLTMGKDPEALHALVVPTLAEFRVCFSQRFPNAHMTRLSLPDMEKHIQSKINCKRTSQQGHQLHLELSYLFDLYYNNSTGVVVDRRDEPEAVLNTLIGIEKWLFWSTNPNPVFEGVTLLQRVDTLLTTSSGVRTKTHKQAMAALLFEHVKLLLEDLLAPRALAIAMATHPRLGAGSLFRLIDERLLPFIFSQT